ncbi:hypothetical protein [Streptomyces sp. NPDC088789]|uniref:hypothetical protein n=1 Tax=Streptomyces sp. NPDC088789 TaxID=3365899 RepID=UPI0037FD0AC6
MNPPSPLPGDPSALRLRISCTDGLDATPQADTLEQWDVAISHEAAEVGTMTFHKVHLDRGINAVTVVAEASEELDETALALLDPATGNFTEDAGQLLPYIGSACSSWTG